MARGRCPLQSSTCHPTSAHFCVLLHPPTSAPTDTTDKTLTLAQNPDLDLGRSSPPTHLIGPLGAALPQQGGGQHGGPPRCESALLQDGGDQPLVRAPRTRVGPSLLGRGQSGTLRQRRFGARPATTGPGEYNAGDAAAACPRGCRCGFSVCVPRARECAALLKRARGLNSGSR